MKKTVKYVVLALCLLLAVGAIAFSAVKLFGIYREEKAGTTGYAALAERMPVHRIGNAVRPGRAIDAIAAGCELGCRL